MQNLAKRWLFVVSMATLALGIAALSFYKIAIANAYRTFPDLPAANETWLSETALQKPLDSPHAERGRWLMSVIGCRDCHGAALLGASLIDDRDWRLSAPPLVGADARTRDFSSEQWRLALRLGIDDERRGLWGMPRRALLALRDEDASALIGAVRNQPATQEPSTPLLHSRLYPHGYMSVTLRSLWPLDRDEVVPSDPALWPQKPPGEDDTELGDYMAAIAHCASCHQAPLSKRSSSVWDGRQGPLLSTVLGPEGEHSDARQARWQAHNCKTRSAADTQGPASIHRASLFTRRQQEALFLSLRKEVVSADALRP